MKYKKILLTGSSGELGQAIIKSRLFDNLLTPERKGLDITIPEIIENFFKKIDFDAIIHCAALARMKECELNPAKAIETNIIGTCNMVIETIKKEKNIGRKIRFIYISTDGVYPGIRGNYSERDEAIPYNKYGWTKLGAECAVNILSNFCIIRASFFHPGKIDFESSAADAYSSKIPVPYFVKAIRTMLGNDFVGTINIGRGKKADYEHYKPFKPSLKKCKLKDIQNQVSFKMAKDASMDCSLWKTTEKE